MNKKRKIIFFLTIILGCSAIFSGCGRISEREKLQVIADKYITDVEKWGDLRNITENSIRLDVINTLGDGLCVVTGGKGSEDSKDKDVYISIHYRKSFLSDEVQVMSKGIDKSKNSK